MGTMKGNWMKKLTTITAAALLTASLSGAAFAQNNMNAPEPNSNGIGTIQPGTTSTGQAVDPPATRGQVGTTGMAGTSRTTRMNDKSGSGSNMKNGSSRTPDVK
jgi:hypothetical protein